MSRATRGAPLFVQALGLVIVSLVAAQLIAIAVIFNLPTQPPEIYRASELIRVLKTARETPTRDGRPLIVRHRDHIRGGQPENRRRVQVKTAVGRAIGVDPARIELWAPNGPRFFVRSLNRGPVPGDVRGPPAAGATERPAGPPRAQDGPPRTEASREEPMWFGPLQLAVRQPDGHWIVAEPKPNLFLDSWQQRILLILALSVLVVSPLAWLFARRLAGPITAFAQAAERLGRDPRATPLALSGSAEVIAASTAFNMMQERLRRYVEDRTAMIGAIAHDLRTPLTRLKFRIEAVPDDIKVKLAGDIDQMEAMIAATLAFVRDTSRPAERTKLELASLLESVIDEAAETGGDAVVERSEKIVIDGDPIALKRLVVNLVDNALKYGGAVRGRAYAEDGFAIIEVDDDGPGVPPAELDRVFEPFFRGEPSRNRLTGGIGLGLAVVRSIARAHGGDVTLHNRAGGGLRACVRLPI